MTSLKKYFPYITRTQETLFNQLPELYSEWNKKINVISRKDTDSIYERHILHSLGIAKIIRFVPETKILDIGTGGGFPGIPLAILFPETRFLLADSIGKKIKVVEEIVKDLNLTNVKALHARAETINEKFNFIVSRAVTQMPMFMTWTKGKFLIKNNNLLENGVLYLKGGDLSEELKDFPQARVYNLSDFFEEDFFHTKKVVYIKNQ
ncbi:MAG: 16S rRNA (guanine(527)-N(7))-methyltransferase RsmG [Flavobacteriaceae bacterium]|jgi:16S rRNA (guanine527-N7)-methyltransferase|nr:16S rRNA (guanine(527)-N(7))-methyltransferase RsmG [Flavobacteriaceae bacterium]